MQVDGNQGGSAQRGGGRAVLGMVLWSGAALAQSGGGPLNFLDSIFNPSKGNQPAPVRRRHPAPAARRPGAVRTAPPAIR